MDSGLLHMLDAVRLRSGVFLFCEGGAEVIVAGADFLIFGFCACGKFTTGSELYNSIANCRLPHSRRPPGMARRSKEDAGERRTSFLGVHLTPTERAILEQRAQTTGLSLSEFARIVLLSDLKAPAPSARDPQAIRALAVEITRVGNNVNQLAKIANETRALPHERQLREVATLIKATLEKVTA